LLLHTTTTILKLAYTRNGTTSIEAELLLLAPAAALHVQARQTAAPA